MRWCGLAAVHSLETSAVHRRDTLTKMFDVWNPDGAQHGEASRRRKWKHLLNRLHCEPELVHDIVPGGVKTAVGGQRTSSPGEMVPV